MARNPFKHTECVEGVICNACGMVYEKVTNRMSEYCSDCGTHLWSANPNNRTYMVDEPNASACVVRVTSYMLGMVTVAQHEYDL